MRNVSANPLLRPSYFADATVSSHLVVAAAAIDRARLAGIKMKKCHAAIASKDRTLLDNLVRSNAWPGVYRATT